MNVYKKIKKINYNMLDPSKEKNVAKSPIVYGIRMLSDAKKLV